MRDTFETLKTNGVYVVSKLRTHEPDEVIGVVTNLDAASAAVVDDADFWLADLPVGVTDRELWAPNHRWHDDERDRSAYRFQRGQGVMRFLWCEEWTPYTVQWTDLSVSHA